MNRFMEVLENILMPVAEKLNNNRYLTALRNGFMVALPLIIFGSIFVVLANLPFVNEWVGESAWAAYQTAIGPASAATLSIMGLFVIMGIGYKMVEERGGEAIYGAAVAIGAFLVLTPQNTIFELDDAAHQVGGVIPTSVLGAEGMFLGIFTAFIAAELYQYFVSKKLTIKMPAGVPDAVSRSFSALIPITLALTIFLVIRILFSFTPFETVQNFIYTIIQEPLTALGSGLPATIIAVLLIQVFWFFGLHGQIIINSVFDPIWYALNDQNYQAFQAGAEQLPNVVTKQFIDTFIVGIGGSGMTLAVIIGIFLIGRSRQLKELGKLGAPSGVFNVNEPIIFGLPIIMNPLALIPWLLAPVVVAIVTYMAMATGIVPRPAGVIVPWTTPAVLSGYLATGNHIGGAIMQLINIVIVFVIWWPFLKIMDNQYYKTEQEAESK